MNIVHEDALAKERDEKFKKWLQDKTLRDKALEYLRKLDKCRAEEEDSLKEVAVCLLAVDRLMGNDDIGGGDDADENEPDNTDNKKVRQLFAPAARLEISQNMLVHQYSVTKKPA